MDFKDIFESFFGFNKKNDNMFDRKSPFDHNFNDFESEMNRDFEDIVHNFGQMFEVLNQFSLFNDINDSNQWTQLETKQNKSPRDLMLKSNQEIQRQDIDLDQKIKQKGFESIFNEKYSLESNEFKIPETKTLRKSYFYSSFNKNGIIEEQKTTTDELGHIQTFVTKRIGDKSFTQITKRNNNNEIIETKEVFENIDKNDLNDFKQRFVINDDSGNEKPRNQMVVNNYNNNNNTSLLKRLFKFWNSSE